MKRRVLLTERIHESQIIYQQFLEGLGYDVEVARDGLECCRKLIQNRPDILVIDSGILWGGADGVISWMEAHEEMHGLPVVFIEETDKSANLTNCQEDAIAMKITKTIWLQRIPARHVSGRK